MSSFINITDSPWNCVSGQDCTDGIQRAADACPIGGGLYFPRGTWLVSGPIFIEKGLTIFGDPGAVVQVIGNPVCPFILGIPRTFSGGQTIDGSFLAQSGGLYGLRTKGTSWIQAFACPATFGAQSSLTIPKPSGDYWQETQQFTLDFIIDRDTTPWSPNQMLFGMGTAASQYNSFPFAMWTGGDTDHIVFVFRTADIGPSLTAADRKLIIPTAGLVAPYRIQIRLDLATGTIAAYDWSSGSAVAIPGCIFNDSWSATIPFNKGGMHFLGSETFPLMIGTNGQIGQFSGGQTTPLVLYGLRYGAGIVTDFQVGTPNARTIAYLPTPGPSSYGRTIAIGTGSNQGASGATAIWFNNAGLSQCDGITIDGLTVRCMTNSGACIVAGSCINLNIHNCRFFNGSQAFHGILQNYPVFLTDVRLQGFDCALHMFQQSLWLDRFAVEGGGRTMFRSIASNDRLENGFTGPPSAGAWSTYSAFNGTGTGGRHTLRNIECDNENYPQAKCAVFVEQQFQGATHLTIDNCEFGQSSSPVPIVLAQRCSVGDTPPGWQTGKLWIQGMAGVGYSQAVSVLGGTVSPRNDPMPPSGSYGAQMTW